MISKKYKFIFIHIPKTGGNAIQSCLERFSDDRKTVAHHQDGVDRFGLSGHITRKKHETLDHYARFVDLGDYTIVTCRRHPVDRLISSYFTPSLWHHQRRDGSWRMIEPFWDRDRFRAMEIRKASEFMKVEGAFRAPDVLLDFERLEKDFETFLKAQGIPAQSLLPKINTSAASASELDRARADPLIEEIARTLYREDFEHFGFPLPGH